MRDRSTPMPCRRHPGALVLEHDLTRGPREARALLWRVRRARRPVFVILTGVHPEPDPERQARVDDLVLRARLLIVRTQDDQDLLLGAYGADPASVAVVPPDAEDRLHALIDLELERPLPGTDGWQLPPFASVGG